MRRPNHITIPTLADSLSGMLPVLVLGAFFSLAFQPNLLAADVEPDTESPEQEEETSKIPPLPTIDLGRFQIRERHPSEGVTTSVTLTLRLALSPQASESTVDALEHWHHRLRDQIITAVRVAETKDFAEPGLKRFRRMILLRVNRLFKRPLVEDILFNEFTFSQQ